jgi:tRNA threonylcarbamoyladenosine biosynthesis protein TsaE
MTPPAGTRGGDAIEVPSHSVAETQALAGRLEPLLRPGDVILLGGALGAGKTTFVQGLARAMGIPGQVTSPTFTLVREYDNPGGLRLLHADVYRLDHLQEVEDLALAELLDDDPASAGGGAVAVVEWGEQAAAVLPRQHLDIGIEFGAGPDERVVSLRPRGARWSGAATMRALRDAAAGTGAEVLP